MQTNKLWFGTKKYGWGWTPKSWEGWLVLAIYLAITVTLSLLAKSDGYWVVAGTVVSTAILFVICLKKGEKPRWRWG